MAKMMQRCSIFLSRYLVDAISILVTIALIVVWERGERSRIVAEARGRTADQVNLVQEQLSAKIIANLYLIEGLRIQLTQNPEWTQSEFAAYIEKLIANYSDVRHVAVSQDYVVKYLAPLAGNESALGMDYREVPAQLAAVQEVINLGHTVITNKVDLVQGGSAIIGRVPYYLSGSGAGQKWGLIAVVWHLDVLFEPLEKINSGGIYRVATRSVVENSPEFEVIYGDPNVFDEDPVDIKLQLEGNTWEIAAIPGQGWPSMSDSIWMIRIAGMLTICLIVTLAFSRRRKSIAIQSLQTEIGERKQAKAAFRDSERRLRTIMNSVPVGITYVDAEQTIRYANQYYLHMRDMQENAVVGNGVQNVLGEDLLESSAPFMKRALLGEKVHFESVANAGAPNAKHYTADYVPHIQPDGEVLGFFALVQDNTEIKKYSAALIASEGQFRTIFDTISIGIMVIDAQGTIRSTNPAAVEMFDRAADEILGKNVSILLPEASQDTYLKYIRRLADRQGIIGSDINIEITALRKNGESFPVRLDLNEMRLGNEKLFLAAFEDLAEIQSLENQLRQSQKLESVGQLTGGIAHDFNNLLAVVTGNLSLLLDDIRANTGFPANEIVELVQPAIDASERGADLAQRLLAFSRKQSLHPQVIDINQHVSSMENILRRTLGETIDLRIKLKEKGWKVLVDPAMLESTILNLAINGRDAIASGGRINIETADVSLDESYVALHPEAVVGDHILLAIRDTGGGIDPDIIDKVFDPFFTTKEVGSGSGLGLSMVHGFVKQSGGHITIDTRAREGTTVSIYFPRSSQQIDADDKIAQVTAGGGRETVLVVEDEDGVRSMAVRMLERLGYEVIEAADGATAMQHISSTDSIDVVLTDVVLPGDMGGPDIARAAREISSDVAILFMSGYTESSILNLGDPDTDPKLLNKPFTFNELASKIRESISSARANSK